MQNIDDPTGVRMRRITFDEPALSLQDLQTFYEMEELGFELQGWDVYPFRRDGEMWILADDWKSVVRDLFARANGPSPEPTWPKLELDEEARYQSAWNERRTKLLERNPALQRLLEEFVEFVRRTAPEIKLKQNAQTITFVAPNGSKAGLRLRAGRGGDVPRLWLARSTGSFAVRNVADFERGRRFIEGDARAETQEDHQ
jgi:hypothetical protein